MEKNSCKNILVIDELKSPCIEQVIVILKDGTACNAPRDIVEEANEIIDKYSRRIETGQYRAIRQKRGWFFKKKKN